MIGLDQFRGLRLRGGFTVASIELASAPLKDPLGRPALARSRVNGRHLHILIRPELDEKELSVTLYHEILEAASVGSLEPPRSVMDLNEAGFDKAAYEAHDRLGAASPEALNRMLQSFGFGGE